MTPEEHRQRHIELHRMFDELLADWLTLERGSIYQPIVDVMQWSYQQTLRPTIEIAPERHWPLMIRTGRVS
jgi:hypothetical protein